MLEYIYKSLAATRQLEMVVKYRSLAGEEGATKPKIYNTFGTWPMQINSDTAQKGNHFDLRHIDFARLISA